MTAQSLHRHERKHRKLIDRHFARRPFLGPLGVEAEVAMRNHLAGCPSCRDYYDRHALLAQVDPQAVPVRDRLAAALGFAATEVIPRRRPWWLVGLLPLAAALVLVVFRGRTPFESDPGFTARGARVEPGLYAYRVAHGDAGPLLGRMTAGDELAFAYENPTRYSHLLVVAVDERGRLFWYHPDPDVRDRAVPIAQEPGRHELPVAIRHEYSGDSLRILGIFCRQALGLAEVRPLIDRSGCAGLRGRLPGIACVELKVALGEESKP